ncbi:MAG: hypothetical protein E6R03_11175 [Hyphomicrobiaceae bacterium]|nr:MAG: hypothetical protein E6R03_11175 [Hyphomicrobiaceae bacterium]
MRDFTKNASNYVSFGNNTLGNLINGLSKITVHCWAKWDTFDASDDLRQDSLLSIWINGSGSSGLGLAVNGTLGGGVRRLGTRARSQSADTLQENMGDADLSTGTWYALTAVFDFAGTQIKRYLNGASDGTSTGLSFGASSYTQGTATVEDAISSKDLGGTFRQLDGQCGEHAIWNTELDAAEVAALAKGYSPSLVRPSGLIWYLPMLGRFGPEIDIKGGRSGTINGTVAQVDHLPILYPTSPFNRRFGANTAPASSFVDNSASNFLLLGGGGSKR